MRVYPRHRWDLSYRDATVLQEQLRKKIYLRPLSMSRIRRVAGVDVAISRTHGCLIGAVVVHEFPSLDLVEQQLAVTKLKFPYVPGLLSFREIPALIRCLRKARAADVILCDGHGIAHPRGFGLASHLGLLVRKPTIGCAKSLLVGEFGPVGAARGEYASLLYHGERVGSVVRTRSGVKPVFVSPGHLVDHASSRRIVIACATRYRLPEPTRWADRVAGAERRRIEAEFRSGKS